MDRDMISQLALSLTARVFSQLACTVPLLDVLTVLVMVDCIMRNQEQVTALDWLISTRRYLQLQLPERCESRQQQKEAVRLPGNQLALAEIVDRHVSKDTGIMYGIALLEGERVCVVQYEWWEYWYVDAGQIVR